MAESFARTWKEIAIGFLQVGATAYGGPAIVAVPGFIVMLGLTMVYAAYGVNPILRGALYGLGPVVLAIFFAALFRLGTSALRSRIQAFMAIGAAAAALFWPSRWFV